MSKVERAIRAAGARVAAAGAEAAAAMGAGAMALVLVESRGGEPQEYAATLSIVSRDWCEKARRDGAPSAELVALRGAARYAKRIHLRLEECGRDRPLAVYKAVHRTRRGFCRPIPGRLPGRAYGQQRTLVPYSPGRTRAKWDKRLAFAPHVGPVFMRGMGLNAMVERIRYQRRAA